MDRSTRRMPDPGAPRPYGERRRSVRQRLHTPVYVSFNTPQSGAVLDLSELLDLHEDGFAVQTALPTTVPQANQLEVNRAVTLCLDLPETRQYVHGSGQVMWTDANGRAGIRFSFLPDASRHALKEWLFANLLVASANHTARLRQIEHRRQEAREFERVSTPPEAAEPKFSQLETPRSGDAGHRSSSPSASHLGALAAAAAALPPFQQHAATSAQPRSPMAEPDPISAPAPGRDAIFTPDPAELLTALDDVRRQIREIQNYDEDENRDATPVSAEEKAALEAVNYDAILHLITERAASLTGASGAALALLTEGKVLCRACIGNPAPPVGSEVDVTSGLSGECLRTGAIVSCGDTESDPRVDPEICRMIGIGSFMAAPIFADFRVVGLIEVFSPYPHTFSKAHESVLERLAELVPRAKNRAEHKDNRSKKDDKSNQKTAIEPGITGRPDPEGTPPATSKAKAAQLPPPAERQFDAVKERALEPSAASEPAEHFANAREAAARRLPFSHLVLLVMTIAVAAMALGYLLAPTIEQHLLRPAQAAHNPSPPVAVDRQGRALSSDDLRKLAEQGDADAQWQLGILYHNGEGVPKNDAVAVQWFERAAQQGYVRAQSTLGAYYWAGRGVPQDFSKAYFWSQLALAQGDEDSKSRLEGLSAQMTQAQVVSARQQAEAWLHAHNQTASAKTN